MMYSPVIRRLAVAFCVCLVLGLTLSPVAHAQALYGSIAGNVTDQSAAAVPGVEVTIVSTETNYTQVALTSDTGTYLLKNVPDGNFNLTVGMVGFKEYVAQNVFVTVGTVTRHDVVLQVGDISETITVSSAATVLKTNTTDVSSQLEKEMIEDLPMGGYRNYQSLINLVPGATPGRFQNAVTDTPGRALTTNVNGTNRNSNNTRIDGAMSVNIWLPHHTAYVPPAETVEVVNISTNNFDAEQGFAGGAATTVITKSGTNQLHGAIFWMHENAATNAKDFFRTDKPSSKRNIAGFAVGGPIVKDKLFFFGGFEGTLERIPRFSDSTLPTADQRAGDFSAFSTVIYDPMTGDENGNGRDPFPGNIIPANRLSPQALAMQSLLPLPTNSELTSNHQSSGGQDFDRYNTDIKLDWYRSDTHRIWGKFSWMDATVAKETRFGPGGGGATGGGGDGEGLTDVKVYGFGHTWTLSPNFLIDGNFGFTDMDQQVLTSDLGLGNFGQDVLGIPGTNDTSTQSCPEDPVNRCGGIPRFSVDGFSSFGQVDGWSPIFRDEDSYTFTHNFSYSKGNHQFRGGYDLINHRMDHWQPEIGAGPRGRFNFNRNMTAEGGVGGTDQNAWAGFLLGVPSFAGKSLQWELMTVREWQHAFFFRDRWQITPKLTATLGLRYEYFPLVTRSDRPMEFLDLDTFEVVLNNNIEVSKALFAPRLGFAYRISDDDVFRIGYGITNSPLPFARPLRGFYPLTVAASFEASNDSVPGLEAPAGQGSFTTLADGIPLFEGPPAGEQRSLLPSFAFQRTMPADRVKRGYIQSWNAVYERKLPSDVVMSLGYVGTQTTNQLADHNLNWAPPGGGTEGRQLYPRSTAQIWYWDGWLSSNYHSLQVAVNRRFSNGFFLKGAYTYSRAINMTDDEGWAGLGWNDPALISRNRAQAGYNRPHVLQLAAMYELPWGQGPGAGNALVRDWQINGIFSVNQQAPFTISSSSTIDARENTQTADQVNPNVANLGGIGTGDPYYDPSAFAAVTRVPGDTCSNFDCYGSVGRNTLRGPTWVNLDFSIFRYFALTEGVGLEFRTEFYNLPNNPKFNNPNRDSSSSSFMFITSTDANSPARVIRFFYGSNYCCVPARTRAV